MWSIQELPNALDQNIDAFKSVLAEVSPKQYLHKSEDGAWSFAELIEHMILTDGVIGVMMSGNCEAAEARDSKSILANVESAFKQLDRKFPAMEVIKPKGQFTEKQAAFDQWMAVREQLKLILRTEDPHALVLGFNHPLVGEAMSRYEWAVFCVIHANRHLEQLAV